MTDMADEPSSDERDSLTLQAQIESDSRRIAWEQTYGRRRKKSSPRRGGADEPHLPFPNIGPSAVAASPVCDTTTTDAQANFQHISLLGLDRPSGVYGKLHRRTGRLYVGSSIDTVERVRKHISDLEGGRHHSTRLQSAFKDYGRHEFEFLLIEDIAEFINLRQRERHWIDKLGAYAGGFNSKSRADGPEPSLPTHIENAKLVHLPTIYARLAPDRQDFAPTDADKRGFTSDLRLLRLRKLKQAATAAALVGIGIELPFLQFLWLAVILYFLPVMLFNWPESPKKRAERRYFRAASDARTKAEFELIQFIANRLGIPEQRVTEAYPEAPKIIIRRKERADRYRRLNAGVKRWP
jgi:hypothetical protein